jgi:phosphoglycerate dehydrogenase-like enzyme
VTRAHALVSGGGWRDPSLGYRALRGRELAGATAGIVGFGQIGREVARKCVALGMSVVAYDPLVPARDIEALGGRAASLEDLAAEADFVTLHVPDIESARGVAGREFIARMKPDACLVNTSVGAAVDALALVQALEGGSIAGAALDVFEGQPLPLSSALMSAPNVILTPHIGGATVETVERHSRIMVAEIQRFVRGEPLRHLVNPEYQAAARQR